MTKKDYELIAGRLRYAFPGNNNDTDYKKGRYDAWYIDVMNLQNAFADHNPKFDRNKFLQACGIETGIDKGVKAMLELEDKYS